MTRMPRDLSGAELIRLLEGLGYRVTRQRGSHIRLTHAGPPEAHLTIPAHESLKVGTVADILADVANHLQLTRQEVLDRLFG